MSHHTMMNDHEFLSSLPIGYIFQPRDTQLLDYLLLKIKNDLLLTNKIHAVNFYDSDPETLAGSYEKANDGDNEWYFFTSRHKKHRNGSRPNRVVGDGYWKATGAEIPITKNGKPIGSKMALVYQRKSTKTDWAMTEFRLKNAPAPVQTPENIMRLDDWVICKMQKKTSKSLRGKKRIQEAKESTISESADFTLSNFPMLPCNLDAAASPDVWTSHDPQLLEPVHMRFSSPVTQAVGSYQLGITPGMGTTSQQFGHLHGLSTSVDFSNSDHFPLLPHNVNAAAAAPNAWTYHDPQPLMEPVHMQLSSPVTEAIGSYHVGITPSMGTMSQFDHLPGLSSSLDFSTLNFPLLPHIGAAAASPSAWTYHDPQPLMEHVRLSSPVTEAVGSYQDGITPSVGTTSQFNHDLPGLSSYADSANHFSSLSFAQPMYPSACADSVNEFPSALSPPVYQSHCLTSLDDEPISGVMVPHLSSTDDDNDLKTWMKDNVDFSDLELRSEDSFCGS